MPPDDTAKPPTKPVDATSTAAAPKRWTSRELVGAEREAIIVHDGKDYRLRVTSNDKLILTK